MFFFCLFWFLSISFSFLWGDFACSKVVIFVGCCRFHPLSEFDEGKRSCRRRLAGHNRRRRKTQPEDVTSRLTLPGDGDTKSIGNLDIVNLLAAIARPQGKKTMVEYVDTMVEFIDVISPVVRC